MNTTTIKGYITNLGKYNEGYLIGEWITFPIEDDELKEVLDRIGINEKYEEYFFTDWESEIDLGFDEYVSIEKVNEYAEAIEYWDREKLLAACEVWNADEVLDDDPDRYILFSGIENDYDLGWYWVQESGCYDIPDDIFGRYFDYEAFGRDECAGRDGGYTSYGYIERP